MDEQVTDVTDALPTMEPTTRSKIKKALLTVTAVGAGLLLVDDAVKRFRARKNVKVVVTDTAPPQS